MKNHVKFDSKLLQTNKKWSQLKNAQRTWIAEKIRIAHAEYIEQNGKLPMKKSKSKVLGVVWEKVLARDIWIPHYEYESHVGKMVDRLNRKNPLFGSTLTKNNGEK